MINFTFSSPTKIIFGRGVEADVGAETAKHSKRVLLHFGGGSAEKSGLLGRVRESLKSAGVEWVELGGVQPNPRISLVREGRELCRKNKLDFILAVGGGSVIDSSKAIALSFAYEGDPWDFYEYKTFPMQALGIGVVLTIPAAGSESSTSSVLSNDETSMKRGCKSEMLRPRFAFMNPELTYTLPPYQTASGAADIMAHIMERYFTNVQNVALTDRLCEAALRTVIDNLPKVLANPEDYDARAEIMWAGSLAHNDLLGTGREGDWASHGIEHELSALYDVAHGAGLAVIFPAWMKFVWKHDVPRFARFATEVWGVEADWLNSEHAAQEGIRRMEAFFAASGLPVRLQDLEMPLDRLDEIAARAVMKGNGFLGKFVELDAHEIRIILQYAISPRG